MKKILIILTVLLVSSINAATLNSDKTKYTSTETITINFKNLSNQKKDWIGIYHSTAKSTKWKNVVKWAWTGDKKSGKVNFKNLIEGKYYAKVFYNNSYKAEAKLAFEVTKSRTAPVVQIEKSTFTPTENIIVNFKNMTNHNKDWIAIYPTGASNNFDNVVDWEWTGDKSSGALTFNALPKGNYEIRAFYNNSAAIVYAKTIFSVGNDNEGVNLDFINPHYDSGSLSLYVVGKDTYIKPNPTDLIGIYKKGDSNALKNLKASVLVKDIQTKEFEQTATSKYITLYNINLEVGEYEARYFLNNSFITYKSYSFSVKLTPEELKALSYANSICKDGNIRNNENLKVICNQSISGHVNHTYVLDKKAYTLYFIGENNQVIWQATKGNMELNKETKFYGGDIKGPIIFYDNEINTVIISNGITYDFYAFNPDSKSFTVFHSVLSFELPKGSSLTSIYMSQKNTDIWSINFEYINSRGKKYKDFYESSSYAQTYKLVSHKEI